MSGMGYIDIVERLAEQRRSLTAPLRLPDEHTLAAHHQVARDTIRRALKVLERQEGVVRRRRRGTFLQPLSAKPVQCRGQAIGFVPPWWADSTSAWYTSTVFEGISRWADEQACSLSVLHARARENEDDWIERVRQRKLAGLIWLHPQSRQMPLVQRIARILPVVVVGRHVTDERVYQVTPDYDQAASLIDRHLVNLGHTTYALVGTDILGTYSYKWVEATRAACARRNAEFDSKWQFLDISPFPHHLLPRLLFDFYLPAQPKIQALVLTSSSYLADLASDTTFQQRVGRDLSIVTIDYGIYSIESYWPGRAIDHIACDWQAIGRRAINTLGQRVANQEVPICQTTPVHLEIGRTSVQFQSTEDGSQPDVKKA